MTWHVKSTGDFIPLSTGLLKIVAPGFRVGNLVMGELSSNPPVQIFDIIVGYSGNQAFYADGGSGQDSSRWATLPWANHIGNNNGTTTTISDIYEDPSDNGNGGAGPVDNPFWTSDTAPSNTYPPNFATFSELWDWYITIFASLGERFEMITRPTTAQHFGIWQYPIHTIGYKETYYYSSTFRDSMVSQIPAGSATVYNGYTTEYYWSVYPNGTTFTVDSNGTASTTATASFQGSATLGYSISGTLTLTKNSIVIS